jgi:hypothetical protein
MLLDREEGQSVEMNEFRRYATLKAQAVPVRLPDAWRPQHRYLPLTALRGCPAQAVVASAAPRDVAIAANWSRAACRSSTISAAISSGAACFRVLPATRGGVDPLIIGKRPEPAVGLT